MAIWRSGTLAQRGSLVIGIAFVILGTIGLIVNPDFGTGANTSAESWLVDWNGWHAAATVAVGATGVIAARHPSWALVFLVYNTFTSTVTAVWAMFDSTPAGVFDLPNTSTDIVLHLLTAAISATLFLLQLRRDAAPAAAPA